MTGLELTTVRLKCLEIAHSKCPEANPRELIAMTDELADFVVYGRYPAN